MSRDFNAIQKAMAERQKFATEQLHNLYSKKQEVLSTLMGEPLEVAVMSMNELSMRLGSTVFKLGYSIDGEFDTLLLIKAKSWNWNLNSNSNKTVRQGFTQIFNLLFNLSEDDNPLLEIDSPYMNRLQNGQNGQNVNTTLALNFLHFLDRFNIYLQQLRVIRADIHAALARADAVILNMKKAYGEGGGKVKKRPVRSAAGTRARGASGKSRTKGR